MTNANNMKIKNFTLKLIHYTSYSLLKGTLESKVHKQGHSAHLPEHPYISG